MKLESEFYRLSLKYDVEKMTAEVEALDESIWMPHPTGYPGNSSVPLISVKGERNDDFSGPMAVTPELRSCPYLQQVIASFGEVFGRSRLMRLGPGYEVPEHSDINYHWYSRVRIHIPIITFPEVIFHCAKQQVHMAAGETWIFNSWEMHKVINGASHNRVHLVIDTSGSSRFWDMVRQSDEPHRGKIRDDVETRFIPYVKGATPVIKTERYNTPDVMSPGEVEALCHDLIRDAGDCSSNSITDVEMYRACLDGFSQEWRALWSVYGSEAAGRDAYQALINETYQRVGSLREVALGSNLADARQVFNARILVSCLGPGGEYAKPSPKAVEAKQKEPGRNSPCPCGSGKKYKRCHGA